MKAIASFFGIGVVGRILSRSQAGYSCLRNYSARTIETCATYPMCLNLSRSCLKIPCQGQSSKGHYDFCHP